MLRCWIKLLDLPDEWSICSDVMRGAKGLTDAGVGRGIDGDAEVLITARQREKRAQLMQRVVINAIVVPTADWIC